VPENKVVSLEERAKEEQKPFLEQLLQEGARKLLQAAIENEVIEYIQFHKDRLDENGQRLVVRNGHLPQREVISGAGPIAVRQPRVRHRRTRVVFAVRFCPSICVGFPASML
jgi:putative transposase